MFKVQSCYRDQFWDWCMENHIACEYMGTNEFYSMDSWYIGNEKDRMWAVLRWV